jgi:phospholipid/cholesterol/gamma-HCH transport system substrate-binding protein
MSKYSADEVKTGVFVAVAIAVFLFLLFMIGAFRSSAGSYPVKLHFNFISGLQKGAPVRFAGAMAGKVEKIEIASDAAKSNIEVVISVNKNVTLHENSEAYIDTLGLMGEKYIELTPGSSGTPVLKPESILIGQDPLAMHELYKKGMSIADRMDKTLVTMESLLANSNDVVKDNRGEINETMKNLKDISVEMKAFAKDLKANPWKLFWKGKEKKVSEEKNEAAAPAARKKFLGIF